MHTSPVPYGPHEPARDLQHLLDLPAHTKEEQDRWYAEAQTVQDRIKASEKLLCLPHSLWHFFSDADIRDAQFKQVRAHIAVLETGAVPPDDSQPGTPSGFFRSLWQAVCNQN